MWQRRSQGNMYYRDYFMANTLHFMLWASGDWQDAEHNHKGCQQWVTSSVSSYVNSVPHPVHPIKKPEAPSCLIRRLGIWMWQGKKGKTKWRFCIDCVDYCASLYTKPVKWWINISTSCIVSLGEWLYLSSYFVQLTADKSWTACSCVMLHNASASP